jgi:uncharacterized protein YjbJ (UPF0337 family)
MWNQDEVKGKAERAKGAMKEKAGELLDNEELETEGELDQAEGAAREAAGTARRKAKEAGDAFKEHLPKR